MLQVNYKKFVTSFYTSQIMEGESHEGDPAGGGTGDGAGGGAGGSGDGEGDPLNKDTYTKEDVQKMIESERNRQKEAARKQQEYLETLKTSKNLTDQEKKTLENKIEELTRLSMTKEQLAEAERKKLEHKHSTELQAAKKDAQDWESRFKTTLMQTEIIRASAEHEAFSSDQILALLSNKTNVVPLKDETGNSTGRFEVRVSFPSKDKDGKDFLMDLSVTDAVKTMKDTPAVYGNLFVDTSKGGFGNGNAGGGGGDGPIDPASIKDYKTYMKNREKILRKGN